MTNLPTKHWFEHRVSYGETDCMNVVYYAEYLHIFERARGAYIRDLGMSYTEVEKKGLYLPVREARCRYRSPARYDDLLQVCTVISELSRASITFTYGIYDEDKNNKIAEGTTQHACVDMHVKPMAVPAWFQELIEKKNCE